MKISELWNGDPAKEVKVVPEGWKLSEWFRPYFLDTARRYWGIESGGASIVIPEYREVTLYVEPTTVTTLTFAGEDLKAGDPVVIKNNIACKATIKDYAAKEEAIPIPEEWRQGNMFYENVTICFPGDTEPTITFRGITRLLYSPEGKWLTKGFMVKNKYD